METHAGLRHRKRGGNGGGVPGSGDKGKSRANVPKLSRPSDPTSYVKGYPLWPDLRPTLFGHLALGDFALAFGLLLVACVVRFYRLSHPAVVVFDETHYLKFSTWVLSSEFFFDVNPPFGKWVIAVVASSLGFRPADVSIFKDPQLPIESDIAFAARAPSAIFGSLTVPIFYFVCRQLGLSTEASALGACFILFDSMHVIQSRLTMVDSVLVYFTCVALLCALLLWDAKRIFLRKGAGREFRDVFAVAALLVATGVFCGLAVSVRWTAFATPAVVLIVSVFGVPPFCLAPLDGLEVLVLAFSMFAAYYASFVVFFLSVHKTGTGDAFMSEQFQMCLEGSRPYLAALGSGLIPACKMSMWARFVELNHKIFSYSKGIRGADKWGSTWFQWIVNWRGALYYSVSRNTGTEDSPTYMTALVYTLMNPAMVLIIDLLMGVFGGTVCYLVRNRKKVGVERELAHQLQRGCVLLCAWMFSMLPTMVVYRSGPVYQYLPGLFFAQALGALTFDVFVPAGVTQRACASAMCILLVGAFVYWSPWFYAMELPYEGHAARRWLPRWD